MVEKVGQWRQLTMDLSRGGQNMDKDLAASEIGLTLTLVKNWQIKIKKALKLGYDFEKNS